MSPQLQYGLMVALGGVVALWIRRVESRRLGYTDRPGYRYVGLWCLVGAVIGARAGMFFYQPVIGIGTLQRGLWAAGFDGKTVLGALTGGYLFGELGKKVVGVRFSTGDALAIALPVGQAFGRLGCALAGCCYGTPTDVGWAVHQAGALRHPAAVYESVLCLGLAAVLAAVRHDPRRPAGHLFRYYLIGYAAIRWTTEWFRGEPQLRVGPFSGAQVYCMIMGVAFALSLRGGRSAAGRTGSTARS